MYGSKYEKYTSYATVVVLDDGRTFTVSRGISGRLWNEAAADISSHGVTVTEGDKTFHVPPHRVHEIVREKVSEGKRERV